MSTSRCEHGVVISDTVGVYRCYECEPLTESDFGDNLDLLSNLTPCDECGIVFKDRDAWGAHVCPGAQGR